MSNPVLFFILEPALDAAVTNTHVVSPEKSRHRVCKRVWVLTNYRFSIPLRGIVGKVLEENEEDMSEGNKSGEEDDEELWHVFDYLYYHHDEITGLLHDSEEVQES